MKLKVLKPFRDKENLAHKFEEGEIIEFDKERAINAISLGVVEEVKETAAKPAAPVPTQEPTKEPEIFNEQTNQPAEEAKVETETAPAEKVVAEKPKRGRKTNK